MIKGKIEIKKSGDGFVILEGSKDIYIHRKNTLNALNNDIVKISLHKHKKKTEGKVIEIVERSVTKFIGVLSVSDKHSFLTNIKNLKQDIYISLNNLKNGIEGDKCLVEMTDWKLKDKNPSGKVIEVFGQIMENDAEINSIIAEYGFETKFSNEVLEEVNELPFEISNEEISKRRDMREVLTIAIDPVGAKDRDDSLSFRKITNGNIEVGVHIADVTHYIKKGSKLDLEALSRGTSLYLVDKTVPMLPELLSNGICSLNEGSDKLSYSFIFEFDNDYNLVNQWFGRGVVNMDKAMSYEEAQHLIDTNDDSDIGNAVIELNKCAKSLRSERNTVEFLRTEHRFILDENNVPISIELKKPIETNKLIEEFMLLTNRCVGEFIKSKKTPVLYRVHDSPNIERLQELSVFVSRFGFKLDVSKEEKIKENFDKLMDDIKDSPIESLISTLAVRTMSKAYCTPEEKSHYGLGFSSYVWYTSPIRRYADIISTRVLTDILNIDDNHKKKSGYKKPELIDISNHINEKEVSASRAERDSIKYKQVEYLQSHIGEMFEGIITSVKKWGIYIEIIDNKCEGLIRPMNMNEYMILEDEYCIENILTEKRFYMGDTVSIEIVDIDLFNKQTDLKLKM